MKKQNTLMYIDGENIPAKYCRAIFDSANGVGRLKRSRVYRVGSEPSTRAWNRLAAGNSTMEVVVLRGGSAKDKVDKKIQQDATKEALSDSNIQTVIFVTCDQGFTPTVKNLRDCGKEVFVFGTENTALKLKRVCSRFICL